MLANQKIILITSGVFEQHILKDIARDIAMEFHCTVDLMASDLDPDRYYDPARRQYDANGLLKEIDKLEIPGRCKKMGLFRVDLFIPILTFIFGQAIYKGDSGIISTYRLKNEQYGMRPDEKLFFERFRKVIIHELGHTFGLIHCQVPNCVMRSSTYVEDIDQKQHHFCQRHRTELLELQSQS